MTLTGFDLYPAVGITKHLIGPHFTSSDLNGYQTVQTKGVKIRTVRVRLGSLDYDGLDFDGPDFDSSD